MQWEDDAIIVERRAYGEQSLILTVLSAENGLYSGLVKGARGRRKVGNCYESGNLVSAKWQARLAEHLGHFTCDLHKNYFALFYHDFKKLNAVSSACSLVKSAFPEREPHPESFQALKQLLADLETDNWLTAYVEWEINFLAEMGFGLSLHHCAVTGETEGLAYVSPRTGRAVTAAAAEPYEGKLLSLPGFLKQNDSGDPMRAPIAGNDNEIRAGLDLTGYFLERHMFLSHNKRMPLTRKRFIDSLRLGAQ